MPPKAIVDFEFARYDTFAHDLAMTISQNFVSYGLSSHSIDVHLDTERMRQFLQIYNKGRPLEAAELKAIEENLVERIVTDTGHRNEHQHLLNDDQFREAVRHTKLTISENFPREGIIAQRHQI